MMSCLKVDAFRLNKNYGSRGAKCDLNPSPNGSVLHVEGQQVPFPKGMCQKWFFFVQDFHINFYGIHWFHRGNVAVTKNP